MGKVNVLYKTPPCHDVEQLNWHYGIVVSSQAGNVSVRFEGRLVQWEYNTALPWIRRQQWGERESAVARRLRFVSCYTTDSPSILSCRHFAVTGEMVYSYMSENYNTPRKINIATSSPLVFHSWISTRRMNLEATRYEERVWNISFP